MAQNIAAGVASRLQRYIYNVPEFDPGAGPPDVPFTIPGETYNVGDVIREGDVLYYATTTIIGSATTRPSTGAAGWQQLGPEGIPDAPDNAPDNQEYALQFDGTEFVWEAVTHGSTGPGHDTEVFIAADASGEATGNYRNRVNIDATVSTDAQPPTGATAVNFHYNSTTNDLTASLVVPPTFDAADARDAVAFTASDDGSGRFTVSGMGADDAIDTISFVGTDTVYTDVNPNVPNFGLDITGDAEGDEYVLTRTSTGTVAWAMAEDATFSAEQAREAVDYWKDYLTASGNVFRFEDQGSVRYHAVEEGYNAALTKGAGNAWSITYHRDTSTGRNSPAAMPAGTYVFYEQARDTAFVISITNAIGAGNSGAGVQLDSVGRNDLGVADTAFFNSAHQMYRLSDDNILVPDFDIDTSSDAEGSEYVLIRAADGSVDWGIAVDSTFTPAQARDAVAFHADVIENADTTLARATVNGTDADDNVTSISISNTTTTDNTLRIVDHESHVFTFEDNDTTYAFAPTTTAGELEITPTNRGTDGTAVTVDVYNDTDARTAVAYNVSATTTAAIVAGLDTAGDQHMLTVNTQDTGETLRFSDGTNNFDVDLTVGNFTADNARDAVRLNVGQVKQWTSSGALVQGRIDEVHVANNVISLGPAIDVTGLPDDFLALTQERAIVVEEALGFVYLRVTGSTISNTPDVEATLAESVAYDGSGSFTLPNVENHDRVGLITEIHTEVPAIPAPNANIPVDAVRVQGYVRAADGTVTPIAGFGRSSANNNEATVIHWTDQNNARHFGSIIDGAQLTGVNISGATPGTHTVTGTVVGAVGDGSTYTLSIVGVIFILDPRATYQSGEAATFDILAVEGNPDFIDHTDWPNLPASVVAIGEIQDIPDIAGANQGPLPTFNAMTYPEGTIWLDTTNRAWYVATTTAWMEIGGGTEIPIGTAFPTAPAPVEDDLFILESDITGFSAGFYRYTGTAWLHIDNESVIVVPQGSNSPALRNYNNALTAAQRQSQVRTAIDAQQTITAVSTGTIVNTEEPVRLTLSGGGELAASVDLTDKADLVNGRLADAQVNQDPEQYPEALRAVSDASTTVVRESTAVLGDVLSNSIGGSTPYNVSIRGTHHLVQGDLLVDTSDSNRHYQVQSTSAVFTGSTEANSHTFIEILSGTVTGTTFTVDDVADRVLPAVGNNIASDSIVRRQIKIITQAANANEFTFDDTNEILTINGTSKFNWSQSIATFPFTVPSFVIGDIVSETVDGLPEFFIAKANIDSFSATTQADVDNAAPTNITTVWTRITNLRNVQDPIATVNNQGQVAIDSDITLPDIQRAFGIPATLGQLTDVHIPADGNFATMVNDELSDLFTGDAGPPAVAPVITAGDFWTSTMHGSWTFAPTGGLTDDQQTLIDSLTIGEHIRLTFGTAGPFTFNITQVDTGSNNSREVSFELIETTGTTTYAAISGQTVNDATVYYTYTTARFANVSVHVENIPNNAILTWDGTTNRWELGSLSTGEVEDGSIHIWDAAVLYPRNAVIGTFGDTEGADYTAGDQIRLFLLDAEVVAGTDPRSASVTGWREVTPGRTVAYDAVGNASRMDTLEGYRGQEQGAITVRADEGNFIDVLATGIDNRVQVRANTGFFRRVLLTQGFLLTEGTAVGPRVPYTGDMLGTGNDVIYWYQTDAFTGADGATFRDGWYDSSDTSGTIVNNGFLVGF